MSSGHPPRTRPLFVWLGAICAGIAFALLLAGPAFQANSAQAQDEPREYLQRLDGANGFEGYGRVKLIEQGERTRVIVAIHNVAEGQFIPAIHLGTCATYSGEPAFPLAPFPFDDRSRTTVDIRFDDLLSGGYLVDIHPLATTSTELFDPATAVVCGEIHPETIAGPEPTVAGAQPTIAPLDEPADDDGVVVTAPPDTGIGPVDTRYWSTITAAVLAAMAITFAAAGFDLRRRSFVTVAQRRLYRLTGREL